MKLNRTTLNKLVGIFEELEYEVIYEKGSFQSGYCIVEQKKIIVINKFFDIEARINCLIDILDKIEIQTALLSKASQNFLFQLTREEIPFPKAD